MESLTTVPLIVAMLLGALLGAVLGALVTYLALNGRQRTLLQEHAVRVESAQASLEHETERRREIEADLVRTRDLARQLDRDLAVAHERVETTREMVESQKGFIAQSRQEIEDTFRALAASALKGNTEQFLALAQQRLARAQSEGSSELEERKKAIETLLNPLQQTLSRLDKKTGELENSRVEAYSRLDQQLSLLMDTTSHLGEKTTSLETALRGSQVQGRWGEISLRNVAELAGLSEHTDFIEQLTLEGGGRPDMVVRLPGGRLIAVDAKAPLSGYLDAAEAADQRGRDEALARHVKNIRAHIRGLASREYAERLGSDFDMVVLFLPGDAYLGAAFAKDPELQLEAMRSKILIATPTTLLALLRTVAIYWQQESLAKNAEEIAKVARELYERAATFGGQLEKVGKGLRTAVDAYNSAVGSFDRRLMPMKRKLEELKVSEQSKKALTAPPAIETAPRKLAERH